MNPDFTEFVAARHAALVRTAYLLCGDAGIAEDAVQNAWVKVHGHWDRIEFPHSYVRRAVIREVITARRRPWRREVPATVPDLVPPTTDADPDGRVWQALRALPPRQRAVVVLRYYNDLSEAQVAEALGISPGTVKSQASKAMAALRNSLDVRTEISR